MDRQESAKGLGGATAKAYVAAWLGWCFDGLDGYLYIMVAQRLVRQLLEAQAAGPVPASEVIGKAALIQSFFLVGWALGGAVFGRVGDRLGRARTLTLTVLVYALFTGLSFFATAWWHLLVFRFIAALGIGGEWAAGSALVCELMHKRHRWWASALLQSGYMIGCIAASLTAGWMKGLDPRWVFVVGVAPAIFTVWIRWAVPEPAGWVKARATQAMPGVGVLFSRSLLGTTLSITALTSITLTTVWAFLYFGQALIPQLPGLKGSESPEAIQAFASRVSIAYLTVNIFANFLATLLARLLGFRAAFGILISGALLVAALVFGRSTTGVGFVLTKDNVIPLYCLVAVFGLGLFGIFPLYVPLLFPTLVRTLGAGFTYNVGRLVSAAGTIVAGQIAVNQQTAGGMGPDTAIFWSSMLYIPGLLVCFFIAEPREEEAGAPAPCGSPA